ncbi:transglutaminaseTgpA domain-containing protein [Sulfurovum sp.]|uniref:transglutaminase family protein n=1 Tax=Sulfurovum sp. TaxID=1969726 RepID=UPI00356404E1
MLSLKLLQDTKHPPLSLLDMSYIIVLLPLMLVLKVPMLIFTFMVLGILFFKHTPASKYLIVFVFLIGMVTLFLSLYGVFSFRGLSRLKLFLELLVYVLLIVVSMQRLTREINFYLLLSPILFLALSLFFFHGIVMLTYVIFEIFFLLWMVLAHRMSGDLIESFRSSMVMFMYSLPWVVVLFIFFPRISFDHANYGFKGETVQRMGHDGTMFLDSKALLVPSDRIVMEVGFDKEVPSSNTLYFRGSMLYLDKKDHWEPLPAYIKRESKSYYPTIGEIVDYKVTLYPTQKQWIYMLDMPSHTVKDADLDRDLISTVEKPVKEPMHYAASSSLSHKFHDILDNHTRNASSSFDKESNPKTYQEAQKIKTLFSSPDKRAEGIIKFFQTQSLTYSLKPDALDINNTTDSFLFDKRRGYCVHFASSFVTMARMAGIPSRIVTGYKADKVNSLNNYLAIKERDAHAWAELYINEHWVRYETTSTASFIDVETELSIYTDNEFIKKLNLNLMYAKYQVETWILYYSNIRQLQLLQYAKENPRFILLFVLSLLTLVLITFSITSYFRRPRCTHKVLCILEPLFKKMKKEGYTRKKGETLHQYFLRYMEDNPEKSAIKDVDQYYELISYGGNNSVDTMKQLKSMVKKCLSS